MPIPLSSLLRVDAFPGNMKKKATKPMMKVNRRVHIVHFNVGSGYVTYLEEDVAQDCVKVKGIVVDRSRLGRGAKD